LTCLLLGHKYGRAFSRGNRDRMGRWIVTGPDYQTCSTCGAERESPIQFGEWLADTWVQDKEARVVRVREA